MGRFAQCLNEQCLIASKHFVKNTRKKGCTRKHFWVNIFNGKFKPKMDIIKTFYRKSGYLFRFSKNGKGDLTHSVTPSCAPVSVAVYASISLKIPKYPEYPLISLKMLQYCFDYIRALSMSGYVLCLPGFWRCLRLCMC